MKKWISIFVVVLLFIVGSKSAYGRPQITITPTVKGDYQVAVEIDTTLPDGAILSLELRRTGLTEDDPFVGTETQDVPVNGGAASLLIDAQQNAAPSIEFFTQGKYDVVATFSELTDGNERFAQQLKTQGEDIEVTKSINMRGNGKTQKAFQALLAQERKKRDGRQWVMSNVHGGYPWDPDFWNKKFGTWENFDPPTGNPQILRMMYFPSIDVTLLVNIYKNEIATWSLGRSEE